MEHREKVLLSEDEFAVLRDRVAKDLDVTDSERSSADPDAVLHRQLEVAAERLSGDTVVRVAGGKTNDADAPDDRFEVEFVVDDLPYITDSIVNEVANLGLLVHRVTALYVEVDRDSNGRLSGARPADRRGEDAHNREIWVRLELESLTGQVTATEVATRIEQVARQVWLVIDDRELMKSRARQIAAELTTAHLPVPETEVEATKNLLEWLVDGHFTFLGYREYTLTEDGGSRPALQSIAGTSLGLLRDERGGPAPRVLPPAAARRASDPELLILTKANSVSPIDRYVYFDYVGVKTFDKNGKVTGERRFLGLLATSAYAESLRRIPVLDAKADAVLDALGLHPEGHDAKAVIDLLEELPRDELFQSPVDHLAAIATGVLALRDNTELRVFARPEIYDRFVSFLIFLSREGYSTANQRRIEQVLSDSIGGSATIESAVLLASSNLALIHAVVRGEGGTEVDFADEDVSVLEKTMKEAVQDWSTGFIHAVRSQDIADPQSVLSAVDGFSEAYKEDFSPEAGVEDVLELLSLDETQVSVRVTEVDENSMRLKVFRVGDPLTLSGILPWLLSLGVDVTDEHPYTIRLSDQKAWIYEFGLKHPKPTTAEDRANIADSFRATWDRVAEVDELNALTISAGLSWREIVVLRAMAAYMQQADFPFTPAEIRSALVANADASRLLIALFEARFAPWNGAEGADALNPQARDRVARLEAVETELGAAFDQIASLDEDRILRAVRALFNATLRTNVFVRDEDGNRLEHMSFKFAPEQILELPEPRPKYEIFCYSPRVEGVHLRFGDISRGGLRWSDRKDDYRTEVLGLVRAQMVKNTVIIPVGSKGCFYPKQLPPMSDRQAWMAEGRDSYRVFISSLLDITDNIVDGKVVPPANVVRWDGDDPYLVVAADKGTASFSDVANEVSLARGYWLGDAFASGGSVGYDHKEMGITARGAWVSSIMHFRELGRDCQREDVTVVGIGDMSGDVFGNGMLQSEHIRLIGAFDHRHIFIDPNPDAASSFTERRRLASLPGSSWDDYDRSLLSAGGGVFSRTAKSVPISPEIQRALGLKPTVTSMSPIELIRAVLCAPVDLLFNGGIGTYVKGRHESHEEVGDRANNVIRVDGRELRARIVVEGGNLGMTQLGRIEYAMRGGPDRRGGIINTDFIDNSAGVSTSDLEVNIKILLDKIVADGRLDLPARNELLASMTDEVAAHVLLANREQNLALIDAAAVAAPMISSDVAWMKDLAERGVMDIELERLPGDEEIERRRSRNLGLTRPELAVVMAWSKIDLANVLSESDIANDSWFEHYLVDYFPSPIQDKYRDDIAGHRLAEQIVITGIVNQLINRAGFTFIPMMVAETDASVVEIVRAEATAAAIVGTQELRERVESLSTEIPAGTATALRLAIQAVTERISRWFLMREPVGEIAEQVDKYREPVARLLSSWRDVAHGREREVWAERISTWVSSGVPTDLAERIASLMQLSIAFGIVDTSVERGDDPVRVARVHSEVSERLGLDNLGRQISALPRDDRWDAMARVSLREDFAELLIGLVGQVLDKGDGNPAELVNHWVLERRGAIDKVIRTLIDAWSDDRIDLSRVSVAVRHVRMLLK